MYVVDNAVKIMSKRKQTNLFNFGFTKKICHRDELVNVVPKEKEDNLFECIVCKKSLKNITSPFDARVLV
mgnify:CR=1 FL=1